jgi:S1-C subfamily serine protease
LARRKISPPQPPAPAAVDPAPQTAPPSPIRLSERRYSAWHVFGFAAVSLAVVGGAFLAGLVIGCRWGAKASRLMQRGTFSAPFFVTPAVPHLEQGMGQRAYLGVTYDEVTPQLAKQEGLAVTYGALIRRVQEGSPALAADLRRGDVIVAFDGVPVDRRHGLRLLVEASSPGQTVTLTIARGDQTFDVPVTLGVAPSP